MSAIIKTWPSSFSRARTFFVFNHPWARFYFTLGRGKPQRAIDTLFYTHLGDIIGHFKIESIVRNDGSLPKLRSITDQESAWQIKPNAWVAVCPHPFYELKEQIYFPGFRGWRYFDLAAYRLTDDALIPMS